jgi:hypothetical protein
MQVISLNRYYQDKNVTLGVMSICDEMPIYTLELPWRNNDTNVSCIPAGNYSCASYSSPKYPSAYEILNVKDRTKVLIHIGNYLGDTKGCVLPGLGVNLSNVGSPMVTHSASAFQKLKEIVGDKGFKLIIR